MLPLIGRILDRRADVHVLVTTGTVTSARLMGERLPRRALHQYVPVDRIDEVRRFLSHWRPDLALWTESEFWPNLIGETNRRDVPCLLVNARMSDASYARWQRFRGLITPLLASFELSLAQNEREAERLRGFGADNVQAVGNLKWAAPPLPVDAEELDRLRAATVGRAVWLAASTHDGEETAAADVHRSLAAAQPRLLTVIIPRHPERGGTIAADLRASGLTVAVRSRGETIEPATQVYLADGLGELGLFCRLAGVVFIGGSLVAHGGHNPLEPARLDCALLHGPHMFNFATIAEALAGAGATTVVADSSALSQAVSELLGDADLRDRRATAACTAADAEAQILDIVEAAIAPYLDALPRRETPGASA